MLYNVIRLRQKQMHMARYRVSKMGKCPQKDGFKHTQSKLFNLFKLTRFFLLFNPIIMVAVVLFENHRPYRPCSPALITSYCSLSCRCSDRLTSFKSDSDSAFGKTYQLCNDRHKNKSRKTTGNSTLMVLCWQRFRYSEKKERKKTVCVVHSKVVFFFWFCFCFLIISNKEVTVEKLSSDFL